MTSLDDDPDGIEQPSPEGRAQAAARGEALFRSNLDAIERALRYVCRKYHLTPESAEEFASHARLKLMSDDYAILAKFRGSSSLATFLGITISRLLLDYRNAAWGKWRPSAEASRLGPLATELERLAGRDAYSLDQAFEILTTNLGFVTTRAELETLAARLPVRHKRQFEGEEPLTSLPSGEVADGPLIEAERQEALERVHEALREARAALPPRDQLLLSLRYDDGRKMPEVARVLKADAKALYREEDRIKKDIRATLLRRGFDPEGLFD